MELVTRDELRLERKPHATTEGLHQFIFHILDSRIAKYLEVPEFLACNTDQGYENFFAVRFWRWWRQGAQTWRWSGITRHQTDKPIYD